MSKAARIRRSLLVARCSSHGARVTGQKLVVFVTVAILAAIPFGLGKYIEFNTPGPYDSGGYVYSAKHILDGAEIGIEEKPSAQLGTLLVNILGVWLCGFNETGPKLIQTILQATALLLMFIAMRKLFGTLPAAVGVIVASVYLSAPLIAKFGNVKEQYMIAFMVMAISCFVLRQLGGGWWLACLAGAFASWAPLFKPTGMSAIGAMGLFVIVQPLLKHRSWKQTGLDILLLLAGAAAALTPLYVWIIGWNVRMELPFKFVWKVLIPAEASGEQAKSASSYVGQSWQILKPEEKKEAAFRVIRYYWLLILPIALAAGSIVTRLIKMISSRMSKSARARKSQMAISDRRQATGDKRQATSDRDLFVLLFAVWWLLDMAFVWISPRSYEQYYLPMTASAAMLGGYLIAIYTGKLTSSVYKTKWKLVGFIGLICMIAASWHIFFGIEKSPHSGQRYKNPDVRRGYAQRLEEIAGRKKQGKVGAWEIVGEYIYHHSVPDDKIYVWGWYPGIYIKAQRLSSAPKAFEGTMHTLSPKMLSERIDEILSAFGKQPPKFIVDSRKRHFPWDRPPLELWPQTKKGFLPADKQIIDIYDAAYSKWLRDNIGEDEALRYEAMQPFREFVMKNYKIVRPFGQHILFKRK